MSAPASVPSPYECWAWQEIQRYKAGRGGATTRDDGGRPPLLPTPALPSRMASRVAETVLPTVSAAMNDVAQWRVEGGARRRLAKRGVHIDDVRDVATLDLEVLDRSVRGIRARYAPAMTLQGGSAGALGVVGMAVDVPLLIVSNLRAIGEYGSSYGFDLGLLHERVWAGQVLTLGAGTTPGTRAAALWNLHRVSRAMTRGAPWAEIEGIAAVAVAQRLARTLGMELTRGRLLRFLPLVGAVVGGWGDLRLTSQTCDAAYHLYRERFLIRKYGAATWGLAAGPDLDPVEVLDRLTGPGAAHELGP